MTEFEEAMMIRAAAQGDESAARWLDDLYRRTNGRDGLPIRKPSDGTQELSD